jgi:hypothetical protein
VNSCTVVMQPVDPTYPLLPIMSFLCSASLLCVLLTRAYFQSWNLGLMTLFTCLFFDTLINGVNAVIWADNADVIKAYVYCDISKLFQII